MGSNFYPTHLDTMDMVSINGQQTTVQVLTPLTGTGRLEEGFFPLNLPLGAHRRHLREIILFKLRTEIG